MAEPVLVQPPLVVRALRLLTISTLTPLALFLVVAAAMTVGGPSGRTSFIVIMMIFVIVFTWLMLGGSFRRTPDSWGMLSAFNGVFVAFLFLGMTIEGQSDQRFGLPTPVFVVVAVLLTLGILLVSWWPARQAARLVLDDLSSEVVNSSLIIRFTSRVTNIDCLAVTPDSLQIMRRNSFKVEKSHRLSSVSAVAVRTETGDRECPVPGVEKRLIPVTRGEVVVVDLPDGQLVFPAEDSQRLKRFIEERMRRATVEEDGRWL